MKLRILLPILGLALLASMPAQHLAQGTTSGNLTLAVGQKDFLTLEPILVSIKVQDVSRPGLPIELDGKSDLTLEIKPIVKLRSGAKPLPIEAKTKSARTRIYDLLEWYNFPAEGTFTVRALMQGSASAPVTFTIRRPDQKDAEWGPVDRLHHMPWSNYITDAFCGDTFDVAKRWPDSRLTKYCHYWNGLHHQNKKEYDKAVASFELAAKQRDFMLSSHAKKGIAECLAAQGK